MTPGGTLPVQVTVQALNGFTGSVTVNVTGLPSGATASPSSSFAMSAGTQDIVLNIPSNAAQGSLTVGLQATSGSLQHTANIALQIQSQTLANFSIYVQNNELSFEQGGSATANVFLTVAATGNPELRGSAFAFRGCRLECKRHSERIRCPSAPPVRSALSFNRKFDRLSPAYAVVTVTATRTADNMQGAQLELNISPAVGTLPAIRTDYIREDGMPNAAVYDAAHNVVYASNPQWNRVDVISPTTHQILERAFRRPGPTGMDLSLDGSHLFVASNVQQIVSIDTTSLQVVNRTSVPAQGGNLSSIPSLIANTANGSTLIGMAYDTGPPTYTPSTVDSSDRQHSLRSRRPGLAW